MVGCAALVAAVTACDRGVPPELQPDARLRAELGLGDDDEVHTVRITGGAAEQAAPAEVVISPGAWVQFVSDDHRLHEVHFDLGGMGPEPAGFLSGTDQSSSPPLVDLDARFVVSFRDAPPGRYPFVLLGSTDPGRGVVVVELPR